MDTPFPRYRKIEGGIRTLLALFAAHFIVVNGTDYNMFHLLLDRSYYIEMAFSFGVALLLVNWISRVSKRLDRSYGWGAGWLERSYLQLLLCIIVPIIFEFFCVGVYFFFLLHKNILETNFIHTEFRIVILMICCFNLYCGARYLFYKLLLTEKELQQVRQQHSEEFGGGMQTSGNILTASILAEDENRVEGHSIDTKAREIYIVNTTVRSIPVRMDDIAYFYRLNGCNFLRTFEQPMQESYAIHEMLKDIEAAANPSQFFRINRQMIINFNACKSFRQGKGKTIELIIEPIFLEEGEELPFVVVSEDRVKAFREWMER